MEKQLDGTIFNKCQEWFKASLARKKSETIIITSDKHQHSKCYYMLEDSKMMDSKKGERTRFSPERDHSRMWHLEESKFDGSKGGSRDYSVDNERPNLFKENIELFSRIINYDLLIRHMKFRIPLEV